jgi:hypothetical protein
VSANAKPAVSILRGYPPAVRTRLMRLRQLILDAADAPVEEALRWGQAAYLTKDGSPIRIDATKDGRVALYFICTTDLVATFRELHPELSYEGNRAILLPLKGRLPEAALSHCIRLALTYKLRACGRKGARDRPRRSRSPRPRPSR